MCGASHARVWRAMQGIGRMLESDTCLKSKHIAPIRPCGQMSDSRIRPTAVVRRPLSAFDVGRILVSDVCAQAQECFCFGCLRQVFRRPVFRNKRYTAKGFVLRVATISHQRIKYKHMNYKKLLPTILAAFCLPVWADTPPEPRT